MPLGSQLLRNRSMSLRFTSSPEPGRERSGRITPSFGSGTPSNASDSMRSWSAKCSRCRKFGTAAHGAADTAGAQCADTSSPYAAARAATRRNSVTPPQRVMSAWRQSTAPAWSIRPKYARSYPYSPAATSMSTRSRISRRPSRSSEETGSSNHVTPILIFPRDAVVAHPAEQLPFQLLVGQRGEAAAAVHRHLVPGRAEQLHQRDAEQPRLQVPQRRVHRRDGVRHDARPPEVPDRPDHRAPRPGDVGEVRTHDDVAELLLEDRRARPGPVRVPHARGADGRCLDQHHRGRVPRQRAVRLRFLQGEFVDGDLEPFDRGHDFSWSILSRNRVDAMVARRGVPLRNDSPNFLAWSYVTFAGMGGSSAFTTTSSSAGPSCPRNSRTAGSRSPTFSTRIPSPPQDSAHGAKSM